MKEIQKRITQVIALTDRHTDRQKENIPLHNIIVCVEKTLTLEEIKYYSYSHNLDLNIYEGVVDIMT